MPVAELTTEPSTVVHAASNRRMSYGEIAGFAKVPAKLPEIKPDQLKPVTQFRLIGKDVPRIDVRRQVVRQAALRDATCRCRAWSTARSRARRCAAPARPRSTATRSRSMPGIIDAVALDYGVGIIGNTVEAVFAARAQAEGAMARRARARRSTPTRTCRSISPTSATRARRAWSAARPATRTRRSPARPRCIASEFTTDYVYHAQMEPHVLHRLGDARTASRSGPARSGRRKAVAEAAKAAGVDARQGQAAQLQMGGGFGRSVFVEYVIDAVQLSKAAGKPVKMIQTREDDVQYGRFRPMTAQQHRGRSRRRRQGGRLAASDRADTVVPYLYGQTRMDAAEGRRPHRHLTAPTCRTTTCPRMSPTTSMRSAACAPPPGAASARATPTSRSRSMIDELARLAGQDPLAYRVALLKDPRAKKVVETRRQDGGLDPQARRHARSGSRSASSACRRSASR